jgi:hypothetical protein
MKWLNQAQELFILGFDANWWNRKTSLEVPVVDDAEADVSPVHYFFSANARHGLEDTLLRYYQQDAEAYAHALAERPKGPLAVSYVRGRTEDRFDYIFASPKLEVLACRYDYEGAKAAGSDHGIVLADLSLSE